MQSDETAISQLKAGQIKGLRSLVEQYQAQAVQAATLIVGDPSLAEEIVQEAFLRVHAKIGQFDTSRPFKPWFFRMVVNDAVKMASRQRRWVSLEVFNDDAGYQGMLQRLDAFTNEPEEAVQRNELVEEIKRALDRLSPTQKAAVVMYYFLDLSTAEAANRLNCAPGTARWHLSVARERLRSLLAPFK